MACETDRLRFLERDMYGEGHDKPGLMTRVDRLEQRTLGHSKAVVLVVGVVAAVISGLFQVLTAILAK